MVSRPDVEGCVLVRIRLVSASHALEAFLRPSVLGRHMTAFRTRATRIGRIHESEFTALVFQHLPHRMPARHAGLAIQVSSLAFRHLLRLEVLADDDGPLSGDGGSQFVPLIPSLRSPLGLVLAKSPLSFLVPDGPPRLLREFLLVTDYGGIFDGSFLPEEDRRFAAVVRRDVPHVHVHPDDLAVDRLSGIQFVPVDGIGDVEVQISRLLLHLQCLGNGRLPRDFPQIHSQKSDLLDSNTIFGDPELVARDIERPRHMFP